MSNLECMPDFNWCPKDLTPQKIRPTKVTSSSSRLIFSSQRPPNKSFYEIDMCVCAMYWVVLDDVLKISYNPWACQWHKTICRWNLPTIKASHLLKEEILISINWRPNHSTRIFLEYFMNHDFDVVLSICVILKASIIYVTFTPTTHLRAMMAFLLLELIVIFFFELLFSRAHELYKKKIFDVSSERRVPNMRYTIRTHAERITTTYVYGTLSSFKNSNVAACC